MGPMNVCSLTGVVSGGVSSLVMFISAMSSIVRSSVLAILSFPSSVPTFASTFCGFFGLWGVAMTRGVNCRWDNGGASTLAGGGVTFSFTKPAVLAFLNGMLNCFTLGVTDWGEGVTTPVGFWASLTRGVPVLSTPGDLLTGVPRKLGSSLTVARRERGNQKI